MAEDLATRLHAVESMLADLQAEVQRLRAENARLQAADAPAASPEAPPALLGRRRLLVGGATAGAAAVAGLLVTGEPAAAADGGNLILGQTNSSDSETKLVYGGPGNNGFRVEGTSSLAMIEGYQGGTAAGVKGANTANGPGVVAESASGTGLVAKSTGGMALTAESNGDTTIHATSTGNYSPAIWGRTTAANGGNGVYGETESGSAAVRGDGPALGVFGYGLQDSGTGVLGVGSYVGGSIGVRGRSNATGIGVWGECAAATGIRGTGAVGGSFEGTATTLRLDPTAGRAAPTADMVAHTIGDVVIDATGTLWYCTAAGTPGTWRKLGGTGTSGQLHVLPTPARVYDSRTGTSPSQGPKTPLSGNVARTIDCRHNGSGVPAGATAVAITVLLVNAFNGNGNMTIWANGATKPQANTAVWGAGSGRYTTSTISAVDAAAKIQVAASAKTDVVLDIIGYYR